jgi:hypothetical protein
LIGFKYLALNFFLNRFILPHLLRVDSPTYCTFIQYITLHYYFQHLDNLRCTMAAAAIPLGVTLAEGAIGTALAPAIPLLAGVTALGAVSWKLVSWWKASVSAAAAAKTAVAAAAAKAATAAAEAAEAAAAEAAAAAAATAPVVAEAAVAQAVDAVAVAATAVSAPILVIGGAVVLAIIGGGYYLVRKPKRTLSSGYLLTSSLVRLVCA